MPYKEVSSPPYYDIDEEKTFMMHITENLIASFPFAGHQTNIRLTPAVYKYLLHQECALDDLKIEDPSLHQ